MSTSYAQKRGKITKKVLTNKWPPFPWNYWSFWQKKSKVSCFVWLKKLRYCWKKENKLSGRGPIICYHSWHIWTFYGWPLKRYFDGFQLKAIVTSKILSKFCTFYICTIVCKSIRDQVSCINHNSSLYHVNS